MIILSGGAKGSDTLFGNILDTYCYHFSFEGHMSSIPFVGEVIKIPLKNLLERESELIEVFHKLGKDYNIKNTFIKKIIIKKYVSSKE